MTRYIAFLRAVNVGGRTVKMDELRALFTATGFVNVETFIASGNVIFETDSEDAQGLQQQIEDRLSQKLGYPVTTFLRTDAQVAAIADYEPFSAPAQAAAGALNVAFLAEPLTHDDQRKIVALKTAIDDFHVSGTELYWLCQTKQSESTFSNALLERTLGKQATLRGMNTVRRLAAKYPPAEDIDDRPGGR